MRQLCGHSSAVEALAYSNGSNASSSPGKPRQNVRRVGHEAFRFASVESNALRTRIEQRPKRIPSASDRRELSLPQRNDSAITKSLTERVKSTWSALEQQRRVHDRSSNAGVTDR